METLLKGKNAIVYGGSGGIGTGAARTFAREGARVFVTGRTRAKLEAVVEEIKFAVVQRRRPRSTPWTKRPWTSISIMWSVRLAAWTRARWLTYLQIERTRHRCQRVFRGKVSISLGE
jgi:NAD(P)-dependent dehydrogenase (short-subunit alcohol dehydrogenase family)